MGDMSKPASEDTAIAMLASLSDEQLRAELERRSRTNDEAAIALFVAMTGQGGGPLGAWHHQSEREMDWWRKAAKAVLDWKEQQGR